MNIRHSTLIAALALGSATAFAQTTAPAAPASAWTLTGNAGLSSDYTFRGISQTNRKPAFQGGFDIAHSSGLYAGNWNSNVDSGLFNGANLEMDFYGGYKVGGTYTIDGFALGAAFVGTNRDYTAGTAALSGKNISDNTFVVSVSKSF